MRLIRVVRSSNPDKKYDAIFEDDTGRQKVTSFGFRGMDDYTLTGDVEAKERYRSRHRKDLETNDPTRAGYLAYYILWNKPTITESIKDYRQRFNL